MFCKVEINIPLLDAIKQIHKYAKFLKELCVHKRKKMKGSVEVGGIVSTLTKNEDFTAGAQALSKKCRDLRIFSVSCTIGECTFANAMLDLGASINVMLTSIYKSLNFGDLEPTRMTIQLANRSIVQPLGVLEDVLVQVNELIFPTDFYVLDMEDETSRKGSTLIMGRPFLMTAKTKIDVHVGTLSMEFGDTLHPTEDHSLFGIDLIDELVEEYFQLDSHSEDTDIFAEMTDLIGCLGSISEEETDHAKSREVYNLSDSVDNNNDIADLNIEAELLKVLDQVCKHENLECFIEAEVQVAETKNLFSTQLATIFTAEDESAKGSRDQERTEVISAEKITVKVDLYIQIHAETISAKEDQKQAEAESISDLLPKHLKYAYLDTQQQLPVIIANNLHQEQEDKLLQTIAKKDESDHLGCGQERGHKTPCCRDHLPHLDSQWVSPVQVVPKKSGMTVMKNQHDKLVPMQIQNNWRVCIDYRRLNQATRKDHFPLPFID
ncbi:hypothetical protein CR513_42177, partial [Mucuna pruriens]